MIKQNVTLSEEKSHAAKIKLENSQNQKSIYWNKNSQYKNKKSHN